VNQKIIFGKTKFHFDVKKVLFPSTFGGWSLNIDTCNVHVGTLCKMTAKTDKTLEMRATFVWQVKFCHFTPFFLHP
jgi:hypothetical protein